MPALNPDRLILEQAFCLIHEHGTEAFGTRPLQTILNAKGKAPRQQARCCTHWPLSSLSPPPATLIPLLPVSADLQLARCWWHCWKWQGCHLAPPGLQCLAPQSLCKQYKDARARQPQSGEDDRGAKQGSVLLNLVSFPGYLILKRLIWWKCKFFKTYIVFFGGGGLQNILELDLSPKHNYRMVWSSGGHLRLQIQVFFPKQNSFCL